MLNNQDAGDISGLEEVFRSQEFRRASSTAADGPAGVRHSVRRGEGILGTRLGRRPVVRTGDSAPSRDMPDAVEAPVAVADEPPESEQPSSVPASGANALPTRPADDPSAPAWKRHSTRYWTIASVSALVALVAAGVTAGPGQHPRSNVAAQGRHGRSRHGGGLNTSGAGSTGLAAPGGLLAARGRVRRSFVRREPGRRAWFGQRARWTRESYWGGDLHWRSGLARCAVGWRSERGWRGRRLAAIRGHQSRRSGRVHRREHGELCGVVGHDTREPGRVLRPGRGIDHRRREQCHQHGRSGGDRVDRMTTANCRLVASRLRPLSPSLMRRSSRSRLALARRTTLPQPRKTERD